MKYVAWSGGFDSNYLVMKHVLNGETVQPIYCSMKGIETYNGNEKTTKYLKYLKSRDDFQLKTIEYFTDKYSDHILEPIILDAKKYYLENKKEIENIKEEISNLENEIKNFYSNNEEYLRMFPVGVIQAHIFPIIDLSNKMCIKVECGIDIGRPIYESQSYESFFDFGLMLGINEEMKITNSKYTKLANLAFPIYNKTKSDMGKDLIEIDSDIFFDIVENGASCTEKNKKNNHNYCYKCPSCISLRDCGLFFMKNLKKINSGLFFSKRF